MAAPMFGSDADSENDFSALSLVAALAGAANCLTIAHMLSSRYDE
jgi:hypothetical protein